MLSAGLVLGFIIQWSISACMKDSQANNDTLYGGLSSDSHLIARSAGKLPDMLC